MIHTATPASARPSAAALSWLTQGGEACQSDDGHGVSPIVYRADSMVEAVIAVSSVAVESKTCVPAMMQTGLYQRQGRRATAPFVLQHTCNIIHTATPAQPASGRPPAAPLPWFTQDGEKHVNHVAVMV